MPGRNHRNMLYEDRFRFSRKGGTWTYCPTGDGGVVSYRLLILIQLRMIYQGLKNLLLSMIRMMKDQIHQIVASNWIGG